jgi:uncharacterized membrane protein
MTGRRSSRTTAPSQARNNIEAILRLEKEDEQELALHHRFFHAVGWFFGTTYFVSAQCVAAGLWVALNSASHEAIDPYPFPLLSTFLSLEAVLLTSCVLIRQNSIYRTSERRDHLELQINLLAEQEATRSLDMLQRIADHLNVPNTRDLQGDELAEDTAVDAIARDLKPGNPTQTDGAVAGGQLPATS